MIVLTATSASRQPGDIFAAIDGELVTPIHFDCQGNDACRCGTGFSGLASAGLTSTAAITDLPHLTASMLRQAIDDALLTHGWGCDHDHCRDAIANAHLIDIIDMANLGRVGDVLRYAGGEIAIDARAA